MTPDSTGQLDIAILCHTDQLSSPFLSQVDQVSSLYLVILTRGVDGLLPRRSKRPK